MQHSLNLKSAYPFVSLAPTCGMNISQYIYTQPACCSTSSTNTIKQRTCMRRGNDNNDGIGYIWRVFSIFHVHILISSMRLHIYAGLISQSKKNITCQAFRHRHKMNFTSKTLRKNVQSHKTSTEKWLCDRAAFYKRPTFVCSCVESEFLSPT